LITIKPEKWCFKHEGKHPQRWLSLLLKKLDGFLPRAAVVKSSQLHAGFGPYIHGKFFQHHGKILTKPPHPHNKIINITTLE
jgi:hypothetical protein